MLKNSIQGLMFIGEVISKKQTYYIFENGKIYCLFTLKNKENGNFSIIDKPAVEYVYNLMKGEKAVKISDIQKRSKKKNYTENRFDVLSIVYILIAQKKAKIDTRFKGNVLIINFQN